MAWPVASMDLVDCFERCRPEVSHELLKQLGWSWQVREYSHVIVYGRNIMSLPGDFSSAASLKTSGCCHSWGL